MASILSRVRNLISKNFQQTSQEFNRAIYNYLGNSIIWNPENDNTYIEKGYQYNTTIYSIVNLIAKTAATIPFQVYEIKSDNDLKRYKSMTSGIANGSALHKAEVLRKHALEEVADTELHDLLSRPNPSQSYNAWIQEIIAFGKLTGNRYIYGIKPDTGANQGKFKELYVLPSQKVEINSGGIFEPVKSYSLEYNGQYKMEAEDVCHIKDFNPYYDGTGSHLYGMSPLKAGLRSLDTNNEAITTGAKYLQNQTARGVLMSDEGDINEVQAQQLKEKFRQNYSGSNNAGDIVITPKKLSWINFGMSASDLSLIEQYNASIKDLCNIYSVPAVLLNNTESSTYNNVIEAKKSLYQSAVIPELNKIRDELNRWLVPAYGEKLYIDFDYTSISELQEEMDKVVNQMSSAWWLTPNEKRQAMSYGVESDNDKLNDFYIPMNLVPLQDDVIEEDIKSVKIDYNELLDNKERIRRDVFTTELEARERAEAIGCNGTHTHTEDGRTIYMPCASHDDYISLVGTNVKYGDDEEDEEYIDKPVKPGSSVERGLRNKVTEHNDKYGDDKTKRTSYRTLQTVFNRGVGAYRTNPQSVRASVRSEDQWAYARVNSYLYALRNGKFRGGKHDTDLFPSGHPLSSKKSISKAESYKDYPQGATNNAKRMLGWREKYGRDVVKGGTEVGWKRANQLANREPLSLDTVKRIHSFLARHEDNAKISEEYRNEPYKDKGYVAYNLWGGKAMVSWAKRISENAD
jgi:HK97 family phage portal protein